MLPPNNGSMAVMTSKTFYTIGPRLVSSLGNLVRTRHWLKTYKKVHIIWHNNSISSKNSFSTFLGLETFYYLGSGCDRVVTSDTREPQFKSHHQHFLLISRQEQEPKGKLHGFQVGLSLHLWIFIIFPSKTSRQLHLSPCKLVPVD